MKIFEIRSDVTEFWDLADKTGGIVLKKLQTFQNRLITAIEN